MTDKTQPDSGCATGGIVEMLHARIAELEARVQELGAMARENRSRRIVELEAQLEAVVAGGVQALSAAPEAIAKLRHLYQNMVNGAVRDTASAKRIAEGLLAPAIEALERATPPAEQQAAPKAAPGERCTHCGDAKELHNGLRCVNGTENSYWAAPQQKPSQDTMYLLRRLLSNQHTLTGPEFRAELEKIVGEAPQQEAREPVALLVRKNSWRAGQWEAAPPDSPSYGLAWANQRQYVYAAPQPAPAPLSDDVLRDAARYRFLAGHCRSTSEHWGGRWSIIVDGPAPKSHDSEDDLDAAIDAALAAQGGKV